jgi:protein-S-isoprenylcysteine O-methyltransferase Ste14
VGLLNLLIGAAALTIDILFEIPPLPINKSTAFCIFLILIIIYAGLLIWSAFSLMSAKKKNQLAKKGLYSLCRHPMYIGIVLLVNPALAILLRSWSLLEVCLIMYFIWKYFAKSEEKRLTEAFGDEYKEYSKKVGCLFPRTKI